VGRPQAAANVRKHGVSFNEAATVLLDPPAVSGSDPDRSVGESRYITFGMSSLGELLAVFHTYHPGDIGIISARRVPRAESNIYEES